MKKVFENLDSIPYNKPFSDFIKWRNERFSNKKDLKTPIATCVSKEISFLQKNTSDFSITWIGHSTFLIQVNGLNILTDPVWATWMGVSKRMSEPGLKISELPHIDVVLISHNHYDHLHFGSIRKLNNNITFLVPEGLKRTFLKKGFKNVQEFSWWEGFTINNTYFEFVPAQHWSKRSLFDKNTSHWGGWIINSNNKVIYFVGDTGYFRGFQLISEKFAIDYVIMPIGAYEPEWFMYLAHISPEDSIKAFLELKAKHFIPMHYGAYRLADDTGQEALERLINEWNKLGLNTNFLHALTLGETLKSDK